MSPTKPQPAPDRLASMLPLTPAIFHILLVLADGQAHGYAIMQEVDRMTAGAVTLGPGTLYRSLQRMLIEGVIEEYRLHDDSEVDDERRRYFRLTPLGHRLAQAEAKRLATLVATAKQRGLLSRTSEKVPARSPASTRSKSRSRSSRNK